MEKIVITNIKANENMILRISYLVKVIQRKNMKDL